MALPSEDRRRTYRITPAGGAALRTYLEHAQTVAQQGVRRLGALA